MKRGIHPEYYPHARVICACGRTWTTGSTKKEIRTDMCSECHPFFTGEQRIVDTAGQVERFERRLGRKREFESRRAARERKRAERRAREVVIEVPGEPETTEAEAEAPQAEGAASAEVEAEAAQAGGAASAEAETTQAEEAVPAEAEATSSEGEATGSATEGE